MIGDSDLEVWLDQQPNAARTVIVPYVKSIKEMKLKYRLKVVQVSNAGTSQISQGGVVNVDAAKPTSLSTLSLTRTDTGECSIDLILTEGEHEVGRYHFECPR